MESEREKDCRFRRAWGCNGEGAPPADTGGAPFALEGPGGPSIIPTQGKIMRSPSV